MDISYSEKAVDTYQAASIKVFEGEGHGFTPKAKLEVAKLIYDYIKG